MCRRRTVTEWTELDTDVEAAAFAAVLACTAAGRPAAGHDGHVNDSDQVTAAIAELYSGDPDVFTERRRALAAQARAAGDPAAAKKIAALGKPTRSAWVINTLVRADPSVPARLAALGDQLRAGEAALDGAIIRELSRARRDLVDTLVRQAVEQSGQRQPSAAMRDEITDTFSAALADPEVAAQVAAGTLLKAAHWAGFGLGIGTAAPPAPSAAPRKSGASKTGAALTAEAERDEARMRAERQRERRQAVADAEEKLAAASSVADAAAAAVRELEESIRRTEERLADERRRLVGAKRDARQAAGTLARARQALDRLRSS